MDGVDQRSPVHAAAVWRTCRCPEANAHASAHQASVRAYRFVQEPPRVPPIERRRSGSHIVSDRWLLDLISVIVYLPLSWTFATLRPKRRCGPS